MLTVQSIGESHGDFVVSILNVPLFQERFDRKKAVHPKTRLVFPTEIVKEAGRGRISVIFERANTVISE